MVSQVEPFLEFEPDFILEKYDENEEYYVKHGEKPRQWSFGVYQISLDRVMID